ncbi:glycosyltransferase [Vibrio breoganii]
MKIVFFINSFSGGGGERVFVNLANDFYNRPMVEVDFIVGSDQGPNKARLDDRIKITKLSNRCNSISIILNSYKFFYYLIKKSPDVVFSTLELSNALNVSLVRLYNFLYRKNVKVITREANNLYDSGRNEIKKSKGARLSEKFYNMNVSHVSSIIANSPDTKKDVIDFRKVSSDLVKVIPNPVLDAINTEKAVISKNNNLLRLVSVGRLTLQKNYNFAIKVVEELNRRGFQVRYDIYGTGEEIDNLKAEVESRSLGHAVLFKGYSDSISSNLEVYDVFILTSLWEGFGNVIVEALANGLPVVSSNCPGGPKYIIDNSSLGIISDFNVNSFADSITEVIHSDTTSKRLSRIKSCDKYLISEVANQYYMHICGVLND